MAFDLLVLAHLYRFWLPVKMSAVSSSGKSTCLQNGQQMFLYRQIEMSHRFEAISPPAAFPVHASFHEHVDEWMDIDSSSAMSVGSFY
ncbi:hypothetical protein ACIQSO_10465 [Pseudomonas putida]|uniref:hypothetical protein n=1 Tax=Pseudomonas putida TaxID=303 RepID=UPI00383BE11C